jgi:hypothetical protein
MDVIATYSSRLEDLRMVSPDYLAGKTADPSRLKHVFEQRLLPVAIDAAGSVEAALEGVARRTRRQPAVALGLACSASLLLSMLMIRRR